MHSEATGFTEELASLSFPNSGCNIDICHFTRDDKALVWTKVTIVLCLHITTKVHCTKIFSMDIYIWHICYKVRRKDITFQILTNVREMSQDCAGCQHLQLKAIRLSLCKSSWLLRCYLSPCLQPKGILAVNRAS